MRFLVLEDDPEISEVIQNALATMGEAEISATANGDTALDLILAGPFDCLILDRMVEGMDGLSVLEAARGRDVETPALMLTHLSEVSKRTEGLLRGADDYLAKPFAPEELVARVRALMRRAHRLAHPMIRRHGGLELATKTRVAYWEGKELDLTPKEFDCLLALSEHHPDAVSQSMLWDFAWPQFPPDHSTAEQVIHVTMSRLRGKLKNATGGDLIATIKSAGYKLAH